MRDDQNDPVSKNQVDGIPLTSTVSAQTYSVH